MSLTLERVTERLRREAARADGMGRTAKLDLGEAGVVFLDARVSPPQVSNADIDADAVLRVSLEDLGALARGALDPMKALFTRRIKLSGDKGVALKLASLFRESRS